MRTLQPDWDFADKAEGLRGSIPDQSHVTKGTCAEDFCLRAKDGSVVARLFRDVIPKKLYQRAFQCWWDRVKNPVTDRTEVLGTASLPKSTRADGSPSGFYGVNEDILDTPAGKARQETLGLSSHGIAAITEKYPQMLDDNRKLIELVDQEFEKHLPQFREKARTEIKRAPKNYRLWKTAFTSIYLLKGWSSRYHKDTNNLRGVLTAITPVGDFEGGALVLPRWAVAIAFRPGDLLFFNPQEVHGNLPFTGQRISAAFYCGRDVNVR